MNSSWKTDKWFTSPWNASEDARRSLSFRPNIRLHDVTLRDGEQQAGLIFSREEKIALAEKIAEMGIHRIEAGMPVVSAEDRAAIEHIVKMNLPAEVFAFCRCSKSDIRAAAETGVKGVVVEIPCSQHLIEKAYRWDLEKAVALSVEATAYAHELGLYTVFFPIDMSRTDLAWALNLISRVANEGYMDALTIVDTFGGLNMHAVPYLIKKFKDTLQKPIEVHFHDDFGLGVANTIMALASGADVAHTTVSGIGERAGNCCYEQLALSLLTLYGVDLKLNWQAMYELSALLKKITGIPTRPNQCITGKSLNQIESGIITSWYKNVYPDDMLELTPYLPSLVGAPEPCVVLGKGSGLPSIEIYLEQIGVELSDTEMKRELLGLVKQAAAKKHGLLEKSEFEQIVRDYLK
ncbi:MAG: pyruvate carboxyltransferase [Clostridia bacterium]|nr:pyruvate carboxyltransferase [Clostridia bacterium]